MTSEWQKVEDIFKSFRSHGVLETIEGLRRITDMALYPAQKLKFLCRLIQEELIEYPMTLSEPISIDIWKKSLEDAFQVLDILLDNSNILFTLKYTPELRKNYYKGPFCEGQVHVVGDLAALAGDFVFEFLASLNLTEPDTFEYKRRLLEEPAVVWICLNVINYLKSKNDFRKCSEVAELVVNLMHHKSQEEYDVMQVAAHDIEDVGNEHQIVECQPHLFIPKVVPRQPTFPLNCRTLMEEMVNCVYLWGDEGQKSFTMLCDIYHMAIMDRFSDSLKLMIDFVNEVNHNFLSQVRYHKEMTEENFDNQIRFNRAMAQLGVCAFRAGCIAEAHSCLSWLHGSGNIKELLGQHYSYTSSDGRDPKPVEQCGKIPYNMHINLEVLECVHLICGMLVEVLANMYGGKGQLISQEFCVLSQLSKSETSSGHRKKVYDHIMASTRALEEGDFLKSFNLVKSLDIWRLFKNQDAVLQMLGTKIKEVALRMYLFTSSAVEKGKHSTSFDELSTKFELSKDRVLVLVTASKMTDLDRPSPASFFDKLSIGWPCPHCGKVLQPRIMAYHLSSSHPGRLQLSSCGPTGF